MDQAAFLGQQAGQPGLFKRLSQRYLQEYLRRAELDEALFLRWLTVYSALKSHSQVPLVRFWFGKVFDLCRSDHRVLRQRIFET